MSVGHSIAAKRLKTLRRRRDYLNELIKEPNALSWDKAEAAALTWAIKVIEAHWDGAKAIAEAGRQHNTEGAA